MNTTDKNIVKALARWERDQVAAEGFEQMTPEQLCKLWTRVMGTAAKLNRLDLEQANSAINLGDRIWKQGAYKAA